LENDKKKEIKREMILIGSRASYEYDKKNREPEEGTDWDIITTREELIEMMKRIENVKEMKKHEKYNKYRLIMEYEQKGKNTEDKIKKKRYNFEIELVEENNSNKLIEEYCKGKTKEMEIEIEDIKIKTAPMEILYIIKKSHIHHDLKWDKHMEDLMKLKEKIGKEGIKRIEELENILKLRRKEIDIRRGEPKINLNVTNDEFFAQSEKYVNRIVNHDKIHEYVKYGERPLFEEFKKDKNKALIDKNLFMLACHNDKLNCVREEAMALTIERFLLNKKEFILMKYEHKDYSYNHYYKYIIKRLATTLTKGFFRDFIIDNYSDVIECPLDLDKITYKIKTDLSHKLTCNLFELDDIFQSIFLYIPPINIINLSFVNKMFYYKLNSKHYIDIYINKLLQLKHQFPFIFKTLHYFSDKNIDNNINSLIKFHPLNIPNYQYNKKLIKQLSSQYNSDKLSEIIFISHPLSLLSDPSFSRIIPSLPDNLDFSRLYSVYLPSFHTIHCFILITDDYSSDNEESWEDDFLINTIYTRNYHSKIRFIFSNSAHVDISFNYSHYSDSYDSEPDSLSFSNSYHHIPSLVFPFSSNSLKIYNISNLSLVNSDNSDNSESAELFPSLYNTILNKLIFSCIPYINSHEQISETLHNKLFS